VEKEDILITFLLLNAVNNWGLLKIVLLIYYSKPKRWTWIKIPGRCWV
jgi:hypothetical protein